MKRFISFVLMISFLIVVLLSCIVPKDKVLHSLGEYTHYDFYSQGAFQDYTDYAKYYFDSVDLTDNKYFTQIQADDMDDLHEHLDDFENLIAHYRENEPTCEIVVHYDFDRSWIDSEDYLYIDSEWFDPWEGGNRGLASYDIYFFDIQTQTLYYFHNNI